MRLNVDPHTQKKLRAMKYVNDPQLIKLENYRIDEITKKQEIEGKFIKTLTYVQKAKDLKKFDVLSQMINESSKSNISVNLIAGQPFYVYFLVYNSFNTEEIMQLTVKKSNKINNCNEKKYELSEIEIKEKDSLTSVKLINDPEEWKYICETEKLIKPNDYNILTSQNFVLIKSEEVVPILIKITSYDVNMLNEDYEVIVTQKNGQSLYSLTINLNHVANLIDHIFNYYIPESKDSKIILNNPFKSDPNKTELIKKNYYCNDSRIHLELDTLNDDYYFTYVTPKQGNHKEVNFYFYADKYQSILLFSWRVNLFSLTT